MKVAKACRQCRLGKRKCTVSVEGRSASCTPCLRRNLECSKSTKPRSSEVLAPSAVIENDTSSNFGTQLGLSANQVDDYVEQYFRFIHDRPQSIFHEKTLWDELRASTVSPCLLAAICALGCRFSEEGDNLDLGVRLRKKSSCLFSRQLEVISLANVQTCILLANLYVAEQNNELEALYFSIANRMSYILRLFEAHDEDLPILREVKCRVWWTLFMADRWCLPGLGLPREILNTGLALDLPMDEAVFQKMDDISQVFLQDRQDGLWKYMITLVDILGPVQDLNQSLVRDACARRDADQCVAHLGERLLLWYASLPEHMVMNEQNLERYRRNRHGGTLIALHLGYHHYSTLLYFQYLDVTSQSTTEATEYANACRSHALAYSRLLHTARETGDCHVVYLTVAYMTMVSSSVLLHMLLFGSMEEVQTAREHLVYNFEALIELKKYWPHMDGITKRLLMFQNACLRSTNEKTHVMDRWMVRFLLEHALPLGEKSTNEAVYAEQPSPLTPNHAIHFERTNMLNLAFAGLTTQV